MTTIPPLRGFRAGEESLPRGVQQILSIPDLMLPGGGDESGDKAGEPVRAVEFAAGAAKEGDASVGTARVSVLATCGRLGPVAGILGAGILSVGLFHER